MFIFQRTSRIPYPVLPYITHYTSFYRTHAELYQLLSLSLRRLSFLKRPEYISKREKEDKLTDILQRSLKNNVLVLGKDSDKEGRKKMEQIGEVVKDRGYIPIKLKELPNIEYLSPEDKMIRVGGLCRFIIAEDSRPSGHIDEVRLCVNCQYITATLREVGTGSTWMQAHYPVQYNFIKRFCYQNIKFVNVLDHLCDKVNDSLDVAT